MANTTRLTVRLSTLASRTPLNGPATSTRSGELTKAKPSPVTRWVPAPATTLIASRLTPARLTISPLVGRWFGGALAAGRLAVMLPTVVPRSGRHCTRPQPRHSTEAPERLCPAPWAGEADGIGQLHPPTAQGRHVQALRCCVAALGECSVGRSGAPP